MEVARCLPGWFIAAVLIVAAPAPQAAVQTPAGAAVLQPAKPAEAQEIQEIQEVATVVAPSSPTPLELIGRMHPALVHFPIGWLVLLLLLELKALIGTRGDESRAGQLLLIGTLVSFLPAAVTGLIRASFLGTETEVAELLTLHRNLNIGAFLICLLAAGVRYAWREDFHPGRRRIYLVLLSGATLLVLLAGHLGGKMVFGKDYLPF